jgi:hypothetical protein
MHSCERSILQETSSYLHDKIGSWLCRADFHMHIIPCVARIRVECALKSNTKSRMFNFICNRPSSLAVKFCSESRYVRTNGTPASYIRRCWVKSSEANKVLGEAYGRKLPQLLSDATSSGTTHGGNTVEPRYTRLRYSEILTVIFSRAFPLRFCMLGGR